MRQALFEHFQLLLCRRIVFLIRAGLAMSSTALMSIPISPMQRKVGRSISASPVPLPLTRSNTSETKPDYQLLPISPPLSVSLPAILIAPSSTGDVRNGSFADVAYSDHDVCFTPESRTCAGNSSLSLCAEAEVSSG